MFFIRERNQNNYSHYYDITLWLTGKPLGLFRFPAKLFLFMKFRDKIRKKICGYVYNQISNNPHFGLNIKKLHDYSPETWRYKIGSYRSIYEIDETPKIIYIISLDERKDTC